jgi:hypothetical protein
LRCERDVPTHVPRVLGLCNVYGTCSPRRGGGQAHLGHHCDQLTSGQSQPGDARGGAHLGPPEVPVMPEKGCDLDRSRRDCDQSAIVRVTCSGTSGSFCDPCYLKQAPLSASHSHGHADLQPCTNPDRVARTDGPRPRRHPATVAARDLYVLTHSLTSGSDRHTSGRPRWR